MTRFREIGRAPEKMNRESASDLRARRMAQASHKVRRETMKINREFDLIDRDSGALLALTGTPEQLRLNIGS